MKRIYKDITVIALITVIVVISASSAQAATIGPVDDSSTMVSATIPLPSALSESERFSIFGYTSPLATVTIQSPIYGETKADTDGFYEFKYLFLTQFHEDLCIVARDTKDRSTPPLCIPPPTTQANKRVGPVILPPSTSISAGSAYIGDTVTLTGQTIPNTDVKLSLFTDEQLNNKLISLIPEVYAYSVPPLSLTSDKNGEYSIVLPTASSQFLRMFSRAFYEGTSTPKSNTLALDIFPMWMMLFRFFTNILSLFRAHLLDLIILLMLYFLLMYFLKRFFNPHAISTHRHNELAIIHAEMTFLPHEMAAIESRLAVRQTSALLIK